MTHRASISILLCTIGVLTAQAQWNKQDSIRLQQFLNGEGDLKINTEAIKSIHFDFNSSPDKVQGKPMMSQDKPWMKFLEDLPKNYGDTTKWVKPKFVRINPYTPYTKWNEDPVNDPIFLNTKDSLKIGKWVLNVKIPIGMGHGFVVVPGGMDQSVTPSNNPLGTFDANKALYETFTKRGRAIRRNREKANAWKIYQKYIPSKQDSLLLKNKIDSKDKTDKSR